MPSTFKGTQSNPSHLLCSAILMFCCICSSVWPALIPAATWVRSFSKCSPRGDVFHRAHRSMPVATNLKPAAIFSAFPMAVIHSGDHLRSPSPDSEAAGTR